MTLSDQELLHEFVRNGSESAFNHLVQRHVDLVYSAALRQVRSPQLAEDVTQSVFLDLFHSAKKLKPDSVLTTWLYCVTRRTAIDTIRTESSRQRREQAAMELADMKSPDPSWNEIAPLLDEAMDTLDEADRTGILLRYFENKSLRDIGVSLGISDDTAQKRLSRAVDRLRQYFAEQGITVGAAGLAMSISTNAVTAAPAKIVLSLGTASMVAQAIPLSSTITKTLAMTTLQKLCVGGSIALALGVGIYESNKASHQKVEAQLLRQRLGQLETLQRQYDSANKRIAAQNAEIQRLNNNQSELLKLRNEVGKLRTSQSVKTPLEVPGKDHQSNESYNAALLAYEKQEKQIVGASKNLGIAIRLFANDNNGNFPTNFNQLKQELPDNFDLNAIELMNVGLVNETTPLSLSCRERVPRKTPDGKWVRVYGFADGQAVTITSLDGNFDFFESKPFEFRR
ncbi:MAG: hypothetical protein JWN25_1387 [Verrucomicrobiales bacterium]|nr:hypothetical protein [Verrucomicrobiales bacterium]